MPVTPPPLSLERMSRAWELVDLSATIFVALQADQTVELANARACEVLGRPREEIIGRNWFDEFLPPDARETVRAYFVSIIEDGAEIPEVYENPVVSGTGELRIVEWRTRLVYDVDGAVNGLISSGEDVTDRVRALDALRMEKDFVDEVIEATRDTVFVFEPATGQAVRWNRAFREVSGYSDEEIAARRAPDAWYAPEEIAAAQEAMEEVVAGTRDTVRLHLRVKDGPPIPFEYRAAPLLDDRGEVRYLVSIGRDLRSALAEEAKRREMEEQLWHGQKLESLGVLAGGIAHDFANILHSIVGFTSLSLDALPVASPVRENLTQIEASATRATDLCKQMLAYSGKGRFVTEAVALGDLLHDLGQILRVSISKKAALRFELEDALPKVEGDPSQLSQILLNLITNASDAIGVEPGTITLRTGHRDLRGSELRETYVDDGLPAGPYVFVQVSDTGHGMAPDTLARIFDPFFSTKFTGRGLGLAAVLGIVRSHRGAIDVDSVPGSGTTITVYFPEATGVTPATPTREAGPEPTAAGGMILVADDESGIREVCRRVLRRAGYGVLLAEDGREALDMFREHRDEIRCALLDLTMPEMDGEETFRELRRLRDDLPVILSSGYAAKAASGWFEGQAATRFLEKPYSPRDLIVMLRSVLEEGGVTADPS